MSNLNLGRTYWKALGDWSKLIGTGENGKVRFGGVKRFYQNLISKISESSSIPYRVVESSMNSNNRMFKQYLVNIFSEHREYEHDSNEIKELKIILKVPRL